MSARQYKHLLRLVAQWPEDTGKSADRSLRHFLELQAHKFRKDPASFGTDSAACERKFAALERIRADDVLKQYPHRYTSGSFGLSLEQLTEANSEEGRKILGFGRESRWKTLWNKLFPKPSDYKGKE